MMKKFILTLFMGIMALGMIAQDGKITVSGSFKGLGDSVRVFLIDAKGEKLVQENRAIDGENLNLSFDLNDVAFLYVFGFEDGKLSPTNSFSIPALPGEHAVIEGGGDDYTLGGSQFYRDYYEASNLTKAPLEALQAFKKECLDKYNAGVPEAEIDKEFDEKYPALQQALADVVLGYIKEHPDQDASAMLLFDLGNDAKHIIEGAALLTERARGSKAANMYKTLLAALEQEKVDHSRQEELERQMAPDFTLNDLYGKPLTLSSLRGKWVVLDFWGSWCGWCIKGLPKMKEYYAKYKDKLEILGVDCNDTVDKWRQTVLKYQITWLHVYWDKDKGDNPVELYAVRGFPTKVVIDPEGKIAKIVVGEDPAFYNYLDEVLK